MRGKRLFAAVVAIVVVSVLGAGLSVSPAGAAPVAPALVGPDDGSNLTSNPILIWEPVTDAARYRVQISTASNFSSFVTNTTTYNTQYTPPADLAQTTIYWRVRGIDSGNVEGDWSSTWSFVKGAANSPVTLSPSSGQVLDYPDDPLVFSWQPMSGIKNYELQIDSEDTFTPPLTDSATTPNTSWAAPEPQTMDQTFYWRVRGVSPTNVPTLWSEPIPYSSTWPDLPELVYPPDTNDPEIEEVVFEWTPVDGAQYYNLEYSVNSNFTTPTALIQNIRSTRYSPVTTLNNASYFWRVRAKNATGGLGPWSAVRTFTRSWPGPDLTAPPVVVAGPNCTSTNGFAYAQLCTPAHDTLTTELTFEWTPVRLASRYEVQFSPDPNFGFGIVTKTTDHSRYSFPSRTDLADGTWYWRVKGIDQPAPIQGIWSATGTFDLSKEMVTPRSPADGASVSRPVLEWIGKPGDGQYTVTIRRQVNGDVVDTATVSNTAYVPQGLVAAQGPFTWSVEKLGGPAPDPSLQRTFSLVAPALTGSPNPITPALGNVYAPVFQWSARTSATHYQVEVQGPGDAGYTPLAGATNLSRAAFAYSGYDLEAGSWSWRVRAFNGATDLGVGDTGTFHVLGALTTQLLSPAHCPPSLACTEVNDTPTLEWNPVPGVTTYRLYFANDINFTNSSSPSLPGVIDVSNTRYTPPASLFDSQAGQAIYWYVRPWAPAAGPEAGTFATDPDSPVRAFRKRSVPVELLTPTTGSSGPQYGNQITFNWRDYLQTNDDANPRATQVAQRYRIQVSDVADFTPPLEDEKIVDQTTYTPYDRTYPDGPLYWRVQAIDGSNNNLSWSHTGTVSDPHWLVTKQSPVPTQVGPSNGATVGAVPLLTWDPLEYAAAYDIEVYKNPNPPEQGLVTGNRVYQLVNTRITAAIAPIALPAGEYGWRIRRKDADGKPGPWSTETNGGLRKFTLVPAVPSLVAPANGDNVAGNTFLLDWDQVPGATQYRVQTSTASNFSSFKENQATVMTEWAPTVLYADGLYYWRVQSLDSAGNVLATSEVRTFTKGPPQPPGVLFNALAPKRILDSRPGPENTGGYTTPWTTGTTRNVTVAGGSTTVPADADAVTLNVTVTQTTGTSFLSLWPKGEPKPTVSSLNWTAGVTIPNSVTVKVGADRQISVFNNQGSANVIIDVVGYYTESVGAGFTSVDPKRILDSRPGAENVGGYTTPWSAGTNRAIQVAGGSTTVPAGADAVVLNVTVTQTTATSYLSIWPDGQAQPTVSSLNWVPGWTIPNAVTVKVGDGGRVNVFNNLGSAHVLIDVVGYFDEGSGSEFHAQSPTRILDSRPGPENKGGFASPWIGGTNRGLTVVSPVVPSVPPSAEAVLMNVTVTQTTATSYLSIWPNGQTQPTVSSLNWESGWTIPNAVTAKVGTGGQIRIFNNQGSAHVLADVAGWYG